MSKRSKYTRSKYQQAYEKSVEIALTNKDSGIKSQSKPVTTKKKISEYNKFIQVNSSKITGPDRLKKLSKMWKLHKAKLNNAKESDQQKIRAKSPKVQPKVRIKSPVSQSPKRSVSSPKRLKETAKKTEKKVEKKVEKKGRKKDRKKR